MIISQSFMRKVTLRSVWHLYITADQYGNRLYTVANVYQIFRNRRYLQRKIVRKVTLQFYRHSIFILFQFEISSLINLIFRLFHTGILQATAVTKIQFKLGKKSSSSNPVSQTGELQKSSADSVLGPLDEIQTI